jgi:hypothetical protein
MLLVSDPAGGMHCRTCAGLRAWRLCSGNLDAEFFGKPLPDFLGQAVMDAPGA